MGRPRAGALAAAVLMVWGGATESDGASAIFSSEVARSCFDAARKPGDSRAGIGICSRTLEAKLTTEDRAATLINRAILEERVADLGGALRDYDEGLSLIPDLANAYVDRGGVLLKTGHYKAAIADLTKGIALGLERPQIAYYDRGLIREREGDFSGACRDYRQALKLQSSFDAPRWQLGVCAHRGRTMSR